MCEEEWPVYDSDGGGGVVEQEGVTVQWHTYQRITAFCNSYGAECPWAVWQAFCLLDHKLLEGSGSTSSNVEPPVPGPWYVVNTSLLDQKKKSLLGMFTWKTPSWFTNSWSTLAVSFSSPFSQVLASLNSTSLLICDYLLLWLSYKTAGSGSRRIVPVISAVLCSVHEVLFSRC